jgi:dipeptidyl aminopeptidase/acylaminoacyl peptidase
MPAYPPTLLLHGDKDHDVPYEQSLLMEKKLEVAGVKHKLITLVGLDHGFDYSSWTDTQVRSSFDSVLAFLKNSFHPQ